MASEAFDVDEWRHEQRKKQTTETFERHLAEAKREHRELRKSYTDNDRPIPTGRELEIEFAFCMDMPQLLPDVLEKNGSIRGALQHVNDELERMSHYDVDEYGLVSTPTFYKWVDKWADDPRAADVLKGYVR